MNESLDLLHASLFFNNGKNTIEQKTEMSLAFLYCYMYFVQGHLPKKKTITFNNAVL